MQPLISNKVNLLSIISRLVTLIVVHWHKFSIGAAPWKLNQAKNADCVFGCEQGEFRRIFPVFE